MQTKHEEIPRKKRRHLSPWLGQVKSLSEWFQWEFPLGSLAPETHTPLPRSQRLTLLGLVSLFSLGAAGKSGVLWAKCLSQNLLSGCSVCAVYVYGVCVCVRVHSLLHALVWGSQWQMSSPVTLHFFFFLMLVSHWTGSWQTYLDWLASKSLGSSCLHLPQYWDCMYATLSPAFHTDAGALNWGPRAWVPGIPLSRLPSPENGQL